MTWTEVAEALARTVPDVERDMAESLAHAQNLEAIISEEVERNLLYGNLAANIPHSSV